ncbi:MAG: PqqD family peptide modification chaperone [Vicinamibacterales bacterium]
MTPLGLDAVVVRDEDLLSADVGEAVVILQLESNAYLHTEGVGADLWQRLEHPLRIGDLIEALVAEYDVPPDECATDVLAFLERARAEGLIRVVAAGA